MRMMLSVSFPTPKFNEMWRKGEVGPAVEKILADIKPEAAYFGKDIDGQRGAVIVVQVNSDADIVYATEPWFLTFEAEVQVSMCMTPEDLGSIDYKGITEKYG
jgi:hypothetical protein